MIWTYGGPQFLNKLASVDVDEAEKTGKIVRTVVGWREGTLNPLRQVVLKLNHL
jgi:hypothetical protein